MKIVVNSERDLSSAGGGGSYRILPPGLYPAVVHSLERRDTVSKKGIKYWTLRPKLEILVEGEPSVIVSRNDYTLCAVNDKGLPYVPDPTAKNQNPIWGGVSGASQMLSAMKMFKPLGGNQFELDLEEGDRFVPRCVAVRLGVAGFIQGGSNFDHDALKVLHNKYFGFDPQTLEDYERLVEEYNKAHEMPATTVNSEGREVPGGLRLKNVTLAWFVPYQSVVIQQGWASHPETGAVFPDEAMIAIWDARQRDEPTDELPSNTTW